MSVPDDLNNRQMVANLDLIDSLYFGQINETLKGSDSGCTIKMRYKKMLLTGISKNVSDIYEDSCQQASNYLKLYIVRCTNSKCRSPNFYRDTCIVN